MMKYLFCVILPLIQVFCMHTPEPRSQNKYQEYDDYSSEYILPKLRENYYSGTTTESLDKDKIFALILNTKVEMDKTMGILQSERNIDKNVYQVDYLLRFINKNYARFNRIFENINRNKHSLDELQLLRGFTEMKDSKDSLLKTLAVLQPLQTHRFTNKDMVRPDRSIAWSYYDESSLR